MRQALYLFFWLMLVFSSSVVGAVQIEFVVTDSATKQPIPSRIHLKDKDGKLPPILSLPFWRDHFVCPGTARLDLAPGSYSYEVERGPEYVSRQGTFTVNELSPAKIQIELERLVDMAAEGWWSGELHVHRPVTDVELLMRAEDLHVAPVITWWQNRRGNRSAWSDEKPMPNEPLVQFDGNRYMHVMGGEDERGGGALLFFNLRRPLDLVGASFEYPSAAKFVVEARTHKKAWIDIEKPFWWDLPVWLATGEIDSIGLANNHMQRSLMSETEAWGRPRDVNRLPPPNGNGLWSQEIYYHVLNCGLRIPPSAGSASGVLANPVGYNRMYAHVDGEFAYEKWWDAVRGGRVVVTNGPLLRVTVNDQLPGHVFHASLGMEMDLKIKVALTTRDKINALEVIRDGRVERTVPYAEWQKSGSLGSIRFKESGWLLVRVIAENPSTFRFASTAPYYVEIGEAKRRISKTSAKFFLDWLVDRRAQLQLDDPIQLREVLAYQEAAKQFWTDLLTKANAE